MKVNKILQIYGLYPKSNHINTLLFMTLAIFVDSFITLFRSYLLVVPSTQDVCYIRRNSNSSNSNEQAGSRKIALWVKIE